MVPRRRLQVALLGPTSWTRPRARVASDRLFLRTWSAVSQSQHPRSVSRGNARSYGTATKELPPLTDFPPSKIRSFCIIAHIDHGKSTLSDRLLELTGVISLSDPEGRRNRQVLDKLKVERERGITVKAVAVSMFHTRPNSDERYLLNLIDTPGHVDFSSEVHRSLLATRGAILLVDATQGVQAQTVAVLRAARAKGLVVIPVLNKVDLPAAHGEADVAELEVRELLGLRDDEYVLRISAKTGQGVEKVLDAIVEKVPPPQANLDQPFRALIFDSSYDHFQGVVSLISVASGRVQKGDKIKAQFSGRVFEVADCGLLHPDAVSTREGLAAGQCGWLTCAMKDAREAVLGDTFFDPASSPTDTPAGTFETQRCMVFAGLYPVDTAAFTKLDDAIRRLTLNDRSVSVQRESSVALGQGFRLGFLGTLHMDVFRQRLLDEYGSEVIVTRPFVPILLVDGDGARQIDNPVDFPQHKDIRSGAGGRVRFLEPVVDATITVPDSYAGAVMELCSTHRGTQKSLAYIADAASGSMNTAKLEYSLPLAEIVTTFHSSLKSLSSGFATFDYSSSSDSTSFADLDPDSVPAGYAESDLVRLDVVVNRSPVDAFATVVHRTAAVAEGRALVGRLKQVTPRQQYEIVMQAMAGGKVIASERLSATRKDVTAGLYGGHFERKLKHLNKQKEGKKRLRAMSIGKIQIPQEAFSAVLRVDGLGGHRGKQ